MEQASIKVSTELGTFPPVGKTELTIAQAGLRFALVSFVAEDNLEKASVYIGREDLERTS
jgi:hypothetical protein